MQYSYRRSTQEQNDERRFSLVKAKVRVRVPRVGNCVIFQRSQKNVPRHFIFVRGVSMYW